MSDPQLHHQIALSACIVYALEWLKRWPAFRWIDADSDKVNRVVSVFCAFATAVGLSVSMTGSFHAGGVLTIAWPSTVQMSDAGFRFVTQLVMQEGVYRQIVKRPRVSRDLQAFVKAAGEQ